MASRSCWPRQSRVLIQATLNQISDKGHAIFTGYNTDWSFELSGIPTKTLSFDLQIASVPFNDENQMDWQAPEGLVYQETHVFIQVQHFYHIRFADFATLPFYRADGTQIYYMRAICYLPGSAEGTVIPITSPKHIKSSTPAIFLIYMASQYDASDMPPEELEVKSGVPHTDFLRFIPARASSLPPLKSILK